MSKNKKEKISFRKFLARIGIALIAAFGIGSGVKQLSDANPIVAENKEIDKDDIDELIEVSKNDVPIDFNALNKENMGKYLKMYHKAFMERYQDINSLVNSEDPSINNVLYSKDVYGYLKAYYADLCGEELPFDENNFDMDEFNKRLDILTHQYWLKKGGEGLYLDGTRIYKNDKDDLCKKITNDYIVYCQEDTNKNAYFSRLVYNVLVEKIGLKDRPTSNEIYNVVKDEINEQKNRKEFIEELNSNKINYDNNNYEIENKDLNRDEDNER